MKLLCGCGAEIPNEMIAFGNCEYDFEPDGLCGEAGWAKAKCNACGETYESNQDVRESATYSIDTFDEAKEYLAEECLDLVTL